MSRSVKSGPTYRQMQARAMYRALAAAGGYRALADESGWPADDFERWVADTLQRNLLAATAAPG